MSIVAGSMPSAHHDGIPLSGLPAQTVCAGRPEKGMPSWCALGMELPTITKIYAYVKGRSEARLSPGRPALKPGA